MAKLCKGQVTKELLRLFLPSTSQKAPNFLGSRLSGGATEPSQPDLLLWTRPPPKPSPGPDPDPILTRFGPEKADFVSESGQKSGPNQVRGEGFGGGQGQRGRSGWEGSVAPRKVLILGVPLRPFPSGSLVM